MANEAKNVVKEGIVFKRGEGFMAGWKERYLILYIDKRLSYFIIDGLERKGSIWVNNVTADNIQASNRINKSDGANYGFCIQTKNRKWEFCVKSLTERDEWVSKIRLTIQGKAEINKTMQDLSPQSSASSDVNELHQPKQQQKNKLIVHNRNASKSAIATTQSYQQYAGAQKKQYNGYHNGGYNAQKYRPYNNKTQPQQPLSHHASISMNGSYQNQHSQQHQNGYNTQNQHGSAYTLRSQQSSPPWLAHQQQQQQQYMNEQQPPQQNESIVSSNGEYEGYGAYTGFRIRKYDNKSRFSHLVSGYIHQCIDNEFPLKIQNLCQQYIGYILIEGMDLTQIPESKLLPDDEAKMLVLNLLCYGMNEFFISKMELLYKGSRDGLNANAFHSKCDSNPKTVTLCWSDYGNIFGGFTNIPWSTDGQYHSDKNAFLFVLKSNELTAKDYIDYGGNIFPLKSGEEKHSVLHFKDYGPVFGHGHDLALFSLSDNQMDTQSCCHSYSFTSLQLIGGWMYCQIVECEVFRVYTQ